MVEAVALSSEDSGSRLTRKECDRLLLRRVLELRIHPIVEVGGDSRGTAVISNEDHAGGKSAPFDPHHREWYG